MRSRCSLAWSAPGASSICLRFLRGLREAETALEVAVDPAVNDTEDDFLELLSSSSLL